ncbi:hypothetical protein ACP70R_026210 [Stipagrostis hirtigluma subsp. patula]
MVFPLIGPLKLAHHIGPLTLPTCTPLSRMFHPIKYPRLLQPTYYCYCHFPHLLLTFLYRSALVLDRIGSLMEEYDALLPKVPAMVTVDRKPILDAALNKLSLVIEKQETSRLGTREFVSTIVVGGFLNKETLALENRTFHGCHAETEDLAMTSVYDVVLGYLQTTNMIIVQDINRDALVKTQKELFAANTWSMLFESTLAVASKKIAERDSLAAKLSASIQQVCCEHHARLPIDAFSYMGPDGKEQVHLAYTGPASPSTSLDILAKMVIDVYDHLQLYPAAGVSQR